MKSVRLSIVLLSLFGLTLFAAGCVEDLTSVGDDPVMNAKVDGQTWSAGNNVTGTVFSSLKTITGVPGDGSSINLTLTNVFDAGSFEFGSANAEASYDIGTESYNAVNGTINVTSLDEAGNITGTFEFNGENSTGETVAVTDGSFTAQLR